MNSIKERLRKPFTEVDMFKPLALLRSRGEAETSRICPAILSILLFIFFFVIFVREIISMAKYDKIEFEEKFTVQKNLSLKGFDFMIVPTTYPEWTYLINVTAYQSLQMQGANTQLQLRDCTKNESTQNERSIFDDVQLEGQNLTYLCPKHPQEIFINLPETLSESHYLLICVNSINQVKQSFECNEFQCSRGQQFQFNTLINYEYSTIDFFMKKSIINAAQIDSVTQFVDLYNHLEYSRKSWKRMVIQLGLYEIETDYGISTIFDTQPEKQSGYYLSNVMSQDVTRDQNTMHKLGQIQVKMSNKKRTITRTIGKLDDRLAYLGGLFGFLIFFFSTFVYTFNKYSYELSVGESAFNYDEHGNKIKQRQFSYLKYLKFQVYEWAKIFKQPNWKDCKQIYQSKEEANMHMDVRSLFRRIQTIDTIMSFYIEEKKQKLINLCSLPVIDEVKRKRKLLMYYELMIQGKMAINIEDIRHKKQTLQLYKKQIGKKEMSDSEKAIQQEKQQKIAQKIRKNLSFSNDIILKEISQFTEIEEHARNTEMTQDMIEAQKIFAEAYLSLSQKERQQFLETIPLKIVHRLSFMIEKKSEDGSQNPEDILINKNQQQIKSNK